MVHVHRQEHRRRYGHGMQTDMLTYIEICAHRHVCAYMCTDMCLGMHAGTFVCEWMQASMGIFLYTESRVDMRTDTCADMCVDVCRPVYRHVCRHVCRQAFRGAYATTIHGYKQSLFELVKVRL